MITKPLGGGRCDFTHFHARISEEQFQEARRILEDRRQRKAAEAQGQAATAERLPGPSGNRQ